MSQEVLAVLHASPGRRVFGVGSVLTLGAMAVYVAVFEPPGHVIWTILLLALGFAALWLSNRMWQATVNHLELTRTELRSSTGEVLARIGDIDVLERGAFAFKPSNGFTIRLRDEAQAGPRRWEPGLWWRMGRRVGIGGVTPGSQAKVMAELLVGLMAEQAGDQSGG